jgi:outer membrane protein W
MKKVTIVLLAVVFAASLGFAGEPKTKMGDEALLFSFSGLSNLGVGNYGGGIGAKYYFQDDMAFRGSLGFNWSGSTQKDNAASNPGPDDKTTNMSFSLMPGIQSNIATNGSVVAYVGASAGFWWSSSTRENAGHVSGTKTVNTSTSFGIGGFAGFEWFAWDNISLGGEYNLMLNIGSSSNEVTSGGTTTKTDGPSTMGLGFGSSGALTAAVYF